MKEQQEEEERKKREEEGKKESEGGDDDEDEDEDEDAADKPETGEVSWQSLDLRNALNLKDSTSRLQTIESLFYGFL